MNKKYIVIGGIIILLILIIGIFQFSKENKRINNPIINNSVPEINKTKSIKSLVSSLSDFPVGWEVMSQGERTKSDVSKDALTYGWKEGYHVIFRKIESKDVQISHIISKYPRENVSWTIESIRNLVREFSEVINGTRIVYKADDYGQYRIEELPNLNIGDKSIAYKKSYKEGNFPAIYFIEFVKGEYYEAFDGYDYELIKELAIKAESKILK